MYPSTLSGAFSRTHPAHASSRPPPSSPPPTPPCAAQPRRQRPYSPPYSPALPGAQYAPPPAICTTLPTPTYSYPCSVQPITATLALARKVTAPALCENPRNVHNTHTQTKSSGRHTAANLARKVIALALCEFRAKQANTHTQPKSNRRLAIADYTCLHYTTAFTEQGLPPGPRRPGSFRRPCESKSL